MNADEPVIAELVHRYCDALNRRDEELWSSCWADDAVWALRPDLVSNGREAIVAVLRRALASLDAVVQNALHGAVTVDGASATGRWYFAEHYRRRTGEAGLILARYEDEYVERDGRWLFASRTLVPHYEGPPDLSGRFSVGGEGA